MSEYECPKCENESYTWTKQATYSATLRMKVCTDCGHSMIAEVQH